MTIKDIGVHVDHTADCVKRLEAAFQFAQQIGAKLTGIYSKPNPAIPSYSGLPSGHDLIDQWERALAQDADLARESFGGIAKQYDVTTNWRCVTGDLILTLSSEARYMDLMILGQSNPESEVFGEVKFVDNVLLQAGRPCLIIPYIGLQQPMGKHPIVTWNGSRESSRALHDAIPLLRSADKVTLLVSDPGKTPAFKGDDLPGAVIAEHLARHGVEVEVEVTYTYTDGLKTSENLLSLVADHGADMIVMGAYGHSRFRELVLGGMTREILHCMTVPVFMSH